MCNAILKCCVGWHIFVWFDLLIFYLSDVFLPQGFKFLHFTFTVYYLITSSAAQYLGMLQDLNENFNFQVSTNNFVALQSWRASSPCCQHLGVLECVCEGVKKYSLFFIAFYHYGFMAMYSHATEMKNQFYRWDKHTHTHTHIHTYMQTRTLESIFYQLLA